MKAKISADFQISMSVQHECTFYNSLKMSTQWQILSLVATNFGESFSSVTMFIVN